MKKMTTNIGLAALIVTLAASACTLLMPTGSYTVPRQNKDFIHLYTSKLMVMPEWNTNEELRLKKAVFDHSSPEDLPVLYLFPDGLKEGQFMMVYPDSVSLDSANGNWGFDVQNIFSDNGSGFLSTGWWDSGSGQVPGVYRFTDYTSDPTELVLETFLYPSSSIGGKLLGLTWHPAGPSVPLGGYQALWAAGDTIAADYSETGIFTPANQVGFFPDAIPNIDGLFTRLDSVNWPDTSFWNTSTTSLDNFGYAPAGELFWLQASRHSPSTGERETWAYLFGPALGESYRSIDTQRIAWRAGPYLLVQGKEHGAISVYNSHYFAAHSAERLEREFKVYGQTVAYLGEQESSSGIRLLFVSISLLNGGSFSLGKTYYVSVYALPLDALTAGE